MLSALIVLFSMVLFAYWFRNHCRMVLTAKPERACADQVARANNLTFPEVREYLERQPPGEELPALRATLLQEYRVLTWLLRHSSAFEPGGYTFDQRVLMLDFRLMQVWYAVTRAAVPAWSWRALDECSRILVFFAEDLGERTALAR